MDPLPEPEPPLPEPVDPLPEPPEPVEPEPPPEPVDPLPEPPEPVEPEPPPDPPEPPPEPVVFVGDGLGDVGFGDGDVFVGVGAGVQVGVAVGAGVGLFVGVAVQVGVLAADAGPLSLIRVKAVSASTTAARISALAIESPIGRRFLITRGALLPGPGGWLVTRCRHIILLPRGRRSFASPLRHEDDGIADPVQFVLVCEFSGAGARTALVVGRRGTRCRFPRAAVWPWTWGFWAARPGAAARVRQDRCARAPRPVRRPHPPGGPAPDYGPARPGVYARLAHMT